MRIALKPIYWVDNTLDNLFPPIFVPMPPIAESTAFLDPERMLVQHQAALTLLQGSLSNPAVTNYRWLDLACGRGQIIAKLGENLSRTACSKIHFVGYDVDNIHTRNAEKLAQSIDLQSNQFLIGELSDFHLNPSVKSGWNFITLTNTIHELSPANLASVLANGLVRLSDDGCFFIYDMEQLPTLELGAIPWTKDEVCMIVRAMCLSFGSQSYEPEVGRWKHKTCYGWNVQLRPFDMQLPLNWRSRVDASIESLGRAIREVLQQKFSAVKRGLEGLTRFGAETEEEAATKQSLLYDYWAISRALRL